jgi:predicted Rossmann fold nucleotide-binding protein DprA/Smf involved in DNA uptake
MKNLKKNLQAVNKELKALAKKVDQMIVAVGKFEKPKTVKAKPAKKSTTKKPAKLTAVDTILGIIKRSKKGVGVAELMKNTSFDQKKTYNIVYKLKKQGKIKSAGKGVYVKA